MIRHKQQSTLAPRYVKEKLDEFFSEDNIEHDITTKATQKSSTTAQAFFIAKEDLIFAGRVLCHQL